MMTLYEMALADIVSENFNVQWLEDMPNLWVLLSEKEQKQLAFAYVESCDGDLRSEILVESMCVDADSFELNAIARNNANNIFWGSLLKKGLEGDTEVDPSNLVDAMATLFIGFLGEQITDDLHSEVEVHCRNWLQYQHEEEVWERLDGVEPSPHSYQ